MLRDIAESYYLGEWYLAGHFRFISGSSQSAEQSFLWKLYCCNETGWSGYRRTAGGGNTQALANLSAQVEQLKNALAQIQSIPGYESNAELAGQAAQLQAQIESLGNIITLLTGSKSLTDGTLSLCDGITELKSGVTELNDGTQETKAETEKLSFWQKLINLFR